MFANEKQFPNGQPTTEHLLKARGFNVNKDDAGYGSRSGGIKSHARKVIVPVGAHLLRLYHEPGDFGSWWFTPAEYRRICDYFAVSGEILVVGRTKGASAFHGVLALLSEWYDGSPGQLSMFHVVRTRQQVYALYGEGDVATTSGFERTLKPARLQDGVGARQVFLPEPWEYRRAFDVLTQEGEKTDTSLNMAVRKLPKKNLPFE